MKKMKQANQLKAGVLALAVLCIGASSASAATITWDEAYRTGNGGEFTLQDTSFGNAVGGLDGYVVGLTSGVVVSLGTVSSFQTFCVEKNEYISQGDEVNAVLNTVAKKGGQGGTVVALGGDPVSQGTAYLYSLFAKGQLALMGGGGYDYSAGGREASAGLLQNLLWHLEDEIQPLVNSYLTNLLIAEFGTTVSVWKDHQGTNGKDYGVSAVNLTLLDGTKRQDQLYYNGIEPTGPPPTGTPTPDGGPTVLLLGVAFGALWIFRRRLAVA